MQQQSIRRGAIGVEYTAKAVSGWGGLALLIEWLDRIGFFDELRKAVPQTKESNHRIDNFDVVVSFLATVLVGGNRFAHVERLRGDEVVRELLSVDKIASEDTIRRFFLSLTSSQAEDLYTRLLHFVSSLMADQVTTDVLDLDSTILERYGQQEGVAKGYYTASRGQTSHHPLAGMFAKAKHIPLIWLRAGGASTLRGAADFVRELVARLPSGFAIRAIRADSGFFTEEYLRSFEAAGLPYIIPVRMHPPIKRFAFGISEARWNRLDDEHEIADVRTQQHGWAGERRVLFVRRDVSEPNSIAPAYEISALVTTLDWSPRACADFYDQRGECENTIKELKNDFGARGFCLKRFVATEAALRLVTILFNLVSEFKRRILADPSLTLATIRSRFFVIGAILGRSARKLILRLGVHRWQDRFELLLSRVVSTTSFTAPQLSRSP